MDALIPTGEITVKKNNIMDDEVKNDDRLWVDIPSDILCEIYSRLFVCERVMFSSTCRSWNSVCRTRQQFEFSPHNKNNLKFAVPCLLHSNNRVFYPFQDKHCDMDFRRVPSSYVVVAKDGWFFMRRSWREIFLYNPVTKLEVNLPPIEGAGKIKSMNFSSPPTSTGSFAIVAGGVCFRDSDTGFFINTIKSGDDNWCVCEVWHSAENFHFAYCNPVVYEGMFYFLGKDARLLIHDPKSQKNYIHVAPESTLDMKHKNFRSWSSNWKRYLLESDGQILAVFVGYDGHSVMIFRWNICEEMWETVESLEDKMLFVSRPVSVCVKSLTARTGNKIYFPELRGSHGLFYSLSAKKFYTFAATGGTCYESFAGSQTPTQAFWWWEHCFI